MNTDEFSYVLNKPPVKFSKRILLATITQIYDPLDLLAPLVFWAKVLMHNIWSLGLDWYSPLPSSVADRWKHFIKELSEIETENSTIHFLG